MLGTFPQSQRSIGYELNRLEMESMELGMAETELPDEPPSTSRKSSSTRGQFDRGSIRSLENLATRHFSFASKSREARARADSASVASFPSLENLPSSDDTRASVDLQLSSLKIKGKSIQLRTRQESFTPKLQSMECRFHEQLPEARPARGDVGRGSPETPGSFRGSLRQLETERISRSRLLRKLLPHLPSLEPDQTPTPRTARVTSNGARPASRRALRCGRKPDAGS
jgi:hypothetical protein